MADLAKLQTYRARILEALGSGATQITTDTGRTVKTDAADLDRRLSIVDQEILKLVSSTKPSVTRAVISRE